MSPGSSGNAPSASPRTSDAFWRGSPLRPPINQEVRGNGKKARRFAARFGEQAPRSGGAWRGDDPGRMSQGELPRGGKSGLPGSFVFNQPVFQNLFPVLKNASWADGLMTETVRAFPRVRLHTAPDTYTAFPGGRGDCFFPKPPESCRGFPRMRSNAVAGYGKQSRGYAPPGFAAGGLSLPPPSLLRGGFLRCLRANSLRRSIDKTADGIL